MFGKVGKSDVNAVSVGFVSATVRHRKRKLASETSISSTMVQYLCMTNWGHWTLVESSGWMGSLAKIGCHIDYLLTSLLHKILD